MTDLSRFRDPHWTRPQNPHRERLREEAEAARDILDRLKEQQAEAVTELLFKCIETANEKLMAYGLQIDGPQITSKFGSGRHDIRTYIRDLIGEIVSDLTSETRLELDRREEYGE
jgi:hypothetical protein